MALIFQVDNLLTEVQEIQEDMGILQRIRELLEKAKMEQED